MVFLNSKLLHCGLILALAAVLAAGSCERAGGPAFSGVSPVAPGEARIYLYRQGALAAYGQGFDVLVDGKPRGRLTNASYLALAVTPGRHLLAVAPGGRADLCTVQIDAAAGQNTYYEFVFPTGWRMRPSFSHAAIEHRNALQAHAALHDLHETTAFLVRGQK